MAERRMFAKTIVTSDAFLDMPLSARCLYFTLGMFADDDGFVNNPKSIMRQTGACTDDLNLLLVKKFLIAFESGVIVIKHWRINNYLRSDRYSETKYIEEKSQLELDKNGAYVMSGIPEVYPGKDSIGKDSIGNISSINTTCAVPQCDTSKKEEDIFIKLILIDGSYYELSEQIVKDYENLYLNVNVRQAIRNAQAWLISNPTRRKTKRGILKFLNNWIGREQDKGLSNNSNNTTSQTSKDRVKLTNVRSFGEGAD